MEDFFSSMWEIERNLTKKLFSLQKFIKNSKFINSNNNSNSNNSNSNNSELAESKMLLRRIDDLLDELNYGKRTIENKTELQTKQLIQKFTLQNEEINLEYENMFKKTENIKILPPKRSSSNACLFIKEEIPENSTPIKTQPQLSYYNDSGEKKKGPRTFLESTFNSKMSKKVTLETQKSLRDKNYQVISKKDIKETNKIKKRNTFQDELNADWIENLLTEFTPEINEKKAVITVKPPLMKENNVQATEPTAFDVIRNEIDFLKKQLISLIEELDQHNHPDDEGELDTIKIENSRVLSKYLELKEENKEIIERIRELKIQMEGDYKLNQELWNEFTYLKSCLIK